MLHTCDNNTTTYALLQHDKTTRFVGQQMLEEEPLEELYGACSEDEEDHILSGSETESEEESLEDEETPHTSRNFDIVQKRPPTSGRLKNITEGKDGYKWSKNAPETEEEDLFEFTQPEQETKQNLSVHLWKVGRCFYRRIIERDSASCK